MQPYNELTRMGRLRRMRELAKTALEGYGLGEAQLRLVLQAGNTLYRIDDPNPKSNHPDDDLFEPGRYLLRIYQPGWQAPEAIELELGWLAAMRREAGLPVAEPVPRLDGSLLTQVSVPGIPEARSCALLRWIKGRLLPNYGRPEHYRSQGQLMARLHNFTQHWQLPPGHTKRHYDWAGLFMNDAEIGLREGETWNYLPQAWAEPFGIVARQFRQLSEAWGKGPDVYGLIHADMGVDHNVLFWHGEPRLIDFDGSGFGYWMYDLAVALEHLREDPAFPCYRDALLDGYAEYRSLPEAQVARLDLFLAACSVYWDLWAVGATHTHPEYLEEYRQRIDREAALVIGYVASH